MPDAIVLVLDDYHLVTAEAIHRGLAWLLEHQPPRLHDFWLMLWSAIWMSGAG